MPGWATDTLVLVAWATLWAFAGKYATHIILERFK